MKTGSRVVIGSFSTPGVPMTVIATVGAGETTVEVDLKPWTACASRRRTSPSQLAVPQ
jgi:hypothetical protein